MRKINWLEENRIFFGALLRWSSMLCLSGFFFSAGDVRAAGIPQSPDAAVSSSLPLPASPRGLKYFPPGSQPPFCHSCRLLESEPSPTRKAVPSGMKLFPLSSILRLSAIFTTFKT